MRRSLRLLEDINCRRVGLCGLAMTSLWRLWDRNRLLGCGRCGPLIKLWHRARQPRKCWEIASTMLGCWDVRCCGRCWWSNLTSKTVKCLHNLQCTPRSYLTGGHAWWPGMHQTCLLLSSPPPGFQYSSHSGGTHSGTQQSCGRMGQGQIIIIILALVWH